MKRHKGKRKKSHSKHCKKTTALKIIVALWLLCAFAAFFVTVALKLKFGDDADLLNSYMRVFSRIECIVFSALSFVLFAVIFLLKKDEKANCEEETEEPCELPHDKYTNNENVNLKRNKKTKAKHFDSENFKIILLKIILVPEAICGIVAIVGCYAIGIMFRQDSELQEHYLNLFFVWAWGIFLTLGFIIIGIVFSFNDKKLTSDGSHKDYRSLSYDCTLSESIAERCKLLYGETIPLSDNGENFYAYYHKNREVVVVAFMSVDSTFCEEQFVALAGKIPQLTEKILNHTLICIFVEKEKSDYIKEIMHCPEYYGLYDVKVYCVYNPEKKLLRVNKTKSGTGSNPYLKVRKELDKIFCFKRDTNEQEKMLPNNVN